MSDIEMVTMTFGVPKNAFFDVRGVGKNKIVIEIEPPLFVPLAGPWFDAFDRGTKTWEYRRFGPRWNKQTCRVGRRVVLSRGYGKQRRRSGVIVGFRVLPCHRAPKAARAIYKTARSIAAIKIKLDPT